MRKPRYNRYFVFTSTEGTDPIARVIVLPDYVLHGQMTVSGMGLLTSAGELSPDGVITPIPGFAVTPAPSDRLTLSQHYSGAMIALEDLSRTRRSAIVRKIEKTQARMLRKEASEDPQAESIPLADFKQAHPTKFAFEDAAIFTSSAVKGIPANSPLTVRSISTIYKYDASFQVLTLVDFKGDRFSGIRVTKATPVRKITAPHPQRMNPGDYITAVEVIEDASGNKLMPGEQGTIRSIRLLNVLDKVYQVISIQTPTVRLSRILFDDALPVLAFENHLS